MTTTEPAGAATVPIGPPPPFDPELAAGLAAAAEMAGEPLRPSFNPDEIPTLRQAMQLQPANDDDLRRSGAFELEQRLVPGPPGATDVAPADLPGGAKVLGRLPLVPVPAGFTVQPIDPDEVAARLAELALGKPAGRVPDLGGPQVLSFTDVIRIYLRVQNRRRWIVALWMPGLRAVRAGVLLPEQRPEQDQPMGHRTWEEFLTEHAS